jgi:transcriptional regulator with XRE-family HTH domain
MSANYKWKENFKGKLYDNKVKLAYIQKRLNLATKDMAKRLEVSSAFISKLKNPFDTTTRLRSLHIYAICFSYNIPLEIFENSDIDTTDKIDEILNQHHKENAIFHYNKEILNKLVGTWYMYSYPSNLRLTDIWETKTTFYDDYRVEDEHQNQGTINIGQNQTIILKESNGSKNITSITFDNSRIFYNVFLFSRVSKSNSMNKELFNFGLCSRKRLKKALVKEILGDINKVQLQMNYTLLERVSLAIEMDE